MKDIARYFSNLNTILSIGFMNLLRFFYYKFVLKKKRILYHSQLFGPKFLMYSEYNGAIKNYGSGHDWKLFGWFPMSLNEKPDWFRNYIDEKIFSSPDLEWQSISDFNENIGDIKTIWELSRFDWVVYLAQEAAGGNQAALDKLNEWLCDWFSSNPPFFGPNWKCGQESSIRLIHLALASLILEQTMAPTDAMVEAIEMHLTRIYSTLPYAVAQDNNHGTSEAAALFIGGSWLVALNRSNGKVWERAGRKWLENRCNRLVAKDGSFSQYSMNYHRLFIDTYTFVEVWRDRFNLPKFSSAFYERAASATTWLVHMVDLKSGFAPNIGANDGTRLINFSGSDYRDYRDCVQLASAVFLKRRVFPATGRWNIGLQWLNLAVPQATLPISNFKVFKDGGYAVIRNSSAMAIMRFPRFKFRPSQADALHVDFWSDGENLLRDAGTFGYNVEKKLQSYFSETIAHNTIEFDGRSQMARIGRFLFADWLKSNEYSGHRLASVDASANSFFASYKDRWNCSHRRCISLEPEKLIVRDRFCGFKNKAVLRWRLSSGTWLVNGNRISNGKNEVVVNSNVPIAKLEIALGWESPYYLVKYPINVLEVEFNEPGEAITEYFL